LFHEHEYYIRGEIKRKDSINHALFLARYAFCDRKTVKVTLPYFEGFKNYWEINHYNAALDVARNTTDNELLEIIKKYPPKYGLSLGGFQGKYYTADEEGNIVLKSSWENVKKNVQIALERWGDKAYGLLQALINKGGRASYFDLIHEIEKVLGYEYVPSYLLPRLQPLKLVFKTGSNKYPDWTMPPEIIPVVREELEKFRRPLRPITKISFTNRLLRMQQEISAIVDEIVAKRRYINQAFEHKFGMRLFKENEKAICDIRKLCSNEEEFNNRIMALAILIDQIEVDELKKRVKGTYEIRSINLLETFLKENFPNYDKRIILNLRQIVTLRSKKYPVHPDDKKFIEAMNYFGIATFPPDWEELWECALRGYLETLQKLLEILKT
jgi:hypothetical protein